MELRWVRSPGIWLMRLAQLGAKVSNTSPRVNGLKPCPACGRKEGKLVDRRPTRFPYAVICRGCGWSTDFVRISDVA